MICFRFFLQFAVQYDARANTGIERMKIIDAVAKSIPGTHKVDLKNPEKTIIVQVVKVHKNTVLTGWLYVIRSSSFLGSCFSLVSISRKCKVVWLILLPMGSSQL